MEKEFDQRLKRDLIQDAEPLPVSYTDRIDMLLNHLPDNKKGQRKRLAFRYVAVVLCACLMSIVVFSVCTEDQQAGAYSVTVKRDSMYAEIVPSHIMENAAALFEKQVQKSMKYYDKYKDADPSTYIKKIPDAYRDFIEIAKKIQKSDQIVIRHPFYIYQAPYGDYWYEYYFVAEQKNKKLCIFSINVNEEDGSTEFYYDKMMDRYFSLDGIAMEETLFYQVGEVIYAETVEQVSILRDMRGYSGKKMLGGDPGAEAVRELKEKEFLEKKYKEKKDMIFTYLKKIKKGKAVKKSDANMETMMEEEYSELDDTAEEEYGESDYLADQAEHRGGEKMPIGAVIAGIGAVLVVCIIIAFQKRKKR